MTRTLTTDRARTESGFALRFFGAAATVFAAAGGVAAALIEFLGSDSLAGSGQFPPALWLSSGLLLAGSAALVRAVQQVRIERQCAFRRSLLAALTAGTLFVGVQSYGLWCLVQRQVPEEVETGANSFVTVFTAMHGLHFTIALLFVIYVTLKAHLDRYDHEYYWGVTVCGWFWHFLGAVWLAIAAVFAIVAIVPIA